MHLKEFKVEGVEEILVAWDVPGIFSCVAKLHKLGFRKVTMGSLALECKDSTLDKDIPSIIVETYKVTGTPAFMLRNTIYIFFGIIPFRLTLEQTDG